MIDCSSRRRAWLAALALASVCGFGCSSTTQPPIDMTPPSESMLLASRPYTATVPAAYNASTNWPLLIVLAGFDGRGSQTSEYLGFTQLAADQGIFLVTPDADPGLGRYVWNPNPKHSPQFDVEYLSAIIHDLEARYTIDHGRVFIAGHSLGAHMAHRMACDASTDVAAIMSLAGQVTKNPPDCAPASPVSVVQIHGTADMVIGYDGDVQNDPPDPDIPSAHETVATWARVDGCTGGIALTGATLDLDSSLAGSETTIEAYPGCPNGLGVELWSIVGGAHDPVLTPTFAATAWAFLTAHARR